ncbi:hypothetical protein WJX81_001509 [Elliptochloris bilobata]|uniref:F-box domain-containing protein n=1 Tax=Elliptochloris bilobata TaxID=381761 RepID=A0AAW1S6Q6_9CHLO
MSVDNSGGQASRAATTESGTFSAGPCAWSLLPADCQRQVWARLSAHDLARCARTSRDFAAHVAERRSAARSIVLPPGLSPAAVCGYVAAYAGAGEVSLRRCNLHLLQPHQLQVLWASLAAGSAARATGVPVSAVDATSCFGLSDDDVADLCAALPDLRRFVVPNCPMESGFEAAKAAHAPEVPAAAAGGGNSGGGGLQEVCVDGCGDVRDAGVQALLRGGASARTLTLLSISRLDGITRAALELNPRGVLRVLRACGCKRLDRVQMQLPPASPLEELRLAGCANLHMVVLSAPRLLDLNVSSCAKLTTLSLATPSLRTLLATGCKTLRGLGGAFPALRELNVFGCRQLETEALERALEGTPFLERLDVNGCIALGRLAPPQCMCLRTIIATGCTSLRTVSCPSDALRSLALHACAELVDVRLSTTQLRQLDLGNCGKLARLAMPLLEAPAAQLRAAAEAAPEV